VAHLSRLESELKRTQAMVASLRALLEQPPAPVAVAHRSVAANPTLAIAERVTMAGLERGVEGPIREYYLVTPRDTPDESRHRTEVCWPIFRTTPA
jgi:hypothetical protein